MKRELREREETRLTVRKGRNAGANTAPTVILIPPTYGLVEKAGEGSQ
ncbi:MAG: hypothetical protein HYR76_08125 [Ignavibacteria bacterium]|nr:hypothetical protein [Ignavibacteria bacterium]